MLHSRRLMSSLPPRTRFVVKTFNKISPAGLARFRPEMYRIKPSEDEPEVARRRRKLFFRARAALSRARNAAALCDEAADECYVCDAGNHRVDVYGDCSAAKKPIDCSSLALSACPDDEDLGGTFKLTFNGDTTDATCISSHIRSATVRSLVSVQLPTRSLAAGWRVAGLATRPRQSHPSHISPGPCSYFDAIVPNTVS